MRRRDFIIASGVALIKARSAFSESRQRPLIGFLSNGGPQSPAYGWFTDAMTRRGYKEGENFDLAARYSGVGKDERIPDLAAELVRLQPDVIFATEEGGAVACKHLTSSIPIVAGILQDPVNTGLAASEARPGGNVTGMLEAPPGLVAKQLEFAHELFPAASAFGVLEYPGSPVEARQHDEIERAASARRLSIVAGNAATVDDLASAFAQLAAQQVRAVIVLRATLFFAGRSEVAAAALARHLPTLFGWPDAAAAGGLVGYGVNLAVSFDRAVSFLDRILKGAKPAEIPIEFPSKLVMAINLKTARALGVTVPQSLLVQADQVIE